MPWEYGSDKALPPTPSSVQAYTASARLKKELDRLQELMARESEDKSCSVVVGGVEGEVAVEAAGNESGYSESETGTLGIAVKFDETIKDFIFVFRVYSYTGVGDCDHHAVADFVNAETDADGAFGREFGSVGEQIVEHLQHTCGVCEYIKAPTLRVEFHSHLWLAAV